MHFARRDPRIRLLNGLKGEDVEILDLEAGKDYEFVSPNLTSVGLQAFFGCTSLGELDLTMMRYAGFAAFGNCTSLKKVKLSRYTIDIRIATTCS